MADERYSGRDLERNEDPEAVAGAVSGATGAGLGAGLGMAAAGPIGAIVGALAGAAGGWWAGRGAHSALEELDRQEQAFRRAHEHAGATRPYEEVRHGYQLGYLAGRNPRYGEAGFEEAEKDLRAAWVKAHHEDVRPVAWDDVRDSARAGFELARRKG